MTPDEVRMLDNRYALLFIRGERPIMDEKYEILKHPHVELSADGKGNPYEHGSVTAAVASIQLAEALPENGEYSFEEQGEEAAYELYSEEELEALYENQTNK